MKHNHFDVARFANTMAVKASISIDPTQITPRIKNKLLKWLDQAHLDGGYRSEARKLGEILSDAFKLPTTLNTWRGVEARVTDADTARRLSELMVADWSAFILEYPHYTRPDGYYRQRYDTTLKEIKRADGESISLYIHNTEFRTQIVELLAERITPKEREAINKVKSLLMGTEPIHCFTYQ